MSTPTREEIEAAATEHGGYTRAQLQEWGIPWPPPRGWRKRLLRAADSQAGRSPLQDTLAKKRNRLPAEEYFEIGIGPVRRAS